MEKGKLFRRNLSRLLTRGSSEESEVDEEEEDNDTLDSTKNDVPLVGSPLRTSSPREIDILEISDSSCLSLNESCLAASAQEDEADNLTSALAKLPSPSKAERNTTRRKFCLISDNDDDSPDSDNQTSNSSCSTDAISEPMLVTKTINSPHDTKTYVGLVLQGGLSTYQTVQLMMGDEARPYIIRNSLPWHVNANVTFFVDGDSLQTRSDIGVDAWRWECYKTQTTSTSNLADESSYETQDRDKSSRIVKRYYRSKTHEDFKRQIVAIYPPQVHCKVKNKPYLSSTGVVLIFYSFEDKERLIKPDKNPKVYESVRDNIRQNLKSGHRPARATYETEKNLGGLEGIANASSLPKRRHAYEENRKKAKVETQDDPLRDLLTKQRQEGRTGHPVIRRITMDEHSYSIALFNDNVIPNIANYCCTEKGDYKSPLVFDFTFELLIQPPFYALVGSYKNTSLHAKGTTRCPTMLGPVLLCHSRSETTTKVLFDAMLEVCPGLAGYIQVIGYDGEKALSNNGCIAFPAALLLLCANHAKKNIQEKLRDLINDTNLRKTVYCQIFGDEFSQGLAFCLSPDEFDERLEKMTAVWHKDDRLHKFAQYFEVYKADQFRYHLLKGIVEKANIVDSDGLFTTNQAECIISVIKTWQNGKLDPLNFSIAYEKMLEQQESNVLRSFLNLDSTYEVRPEFHMFKLDFNTEYAQKTIKEKQEIKERLSNILVDESCYNEVMGFKPGPVAVGKVRSNVTSLFEKSKKAINNTSCGLASGSPREMASTQPATSENAVICPMAPSDDSSLSKTQTQSMVSQQPLKSAMDSYIFLISNAKPYLTIESIQATISKALSMVQQGELLPAFEENQRFLKSYTSQQPHMVTIKRVSGEIKCDMNCLHFKHEAYCAHTFAVAISENCVENFATYLKRTDKHSLTAIGSVNVNTSKVGKKKPQRVRQREPATAASVKVLLPVRNTHIPQLDGMIMQQAGEQQMNLPPPSCLQHYQQGALTLHSNVQNPRQDSRQQHQFPFLQTSLHNEQQFFATSLPNRISGGQHSNTLGAFTGSHNMISLGQVVLTSLNVCDSRVSSCYGCGKSMKITSLDGRKAVPSAPGDLIFLTKLHPSYSKDGATKVSPSPRNVYFHTTVSRKQFVCIRNIMNVINESIQIDVRCLPYLDQRHVGYILFTMELPHLAPHLALVRN